MIQRAKHDIDAQILEAAVATEQALLGDAVSRAVLSCEFQPQQKAEIDKLLSRNNTRTSTATQKAKLEAYIRVGNFLSLLRAKARVSLAALRN